MKMRNTNLEQWTKKRRRGQKDGRAADMRRLKKVGHAGAQRPKIHPTHTPEGRKRRQQISGSRLRQAAGRHRHRHRHKLSRGCGSF